MRTDPTIGHRTDKRPSAPEPSASETRHTEHDRQNMGGNRAQHDFEQGNGQTLKQAGKLPSPHINVGDAERLLSAIIGASILFAMRRRLFAYLGMVTIAGYLLYRGSSGHCQFYEKAGIDTSGFDFAWLGDKGSGSKTRRRRRAGRKPPPQETEGVGRTPAGVREQLYDEADEASLESFPASDPPSTW